MNQNHSEIYSKAGESGQKQILTEWAKYNILGGEKPVPARDNEAYPGTKDRKQSLLNPPSRFQSIHKPREAFFIPRQTGSIEFVRYHDSLRCPRPFIVELNVQKAKCYINGYLRRLPPSLQIAAIWLTRPSSATEMPTNGPRWAETGSWPRCCFLPLKCH